MDKIFLIATLFSYVFSEDTAQVEKKIKIRACIELARLKIEQDEQILEEVIETSKFDVNETVDKIVSDILLNCFHGIDIESAQQALDRGDNLELTSRYAGLLTYDKEQFKSESLEFTSDQVETYKEIILQMNEMASKNGSKSGRTLLEIEVVYAIGLVVGFLIFFYFAIRSVLSSRSKRVLKKE
jgi:hypothetical protein